MARTTWVTGTEPKRRSLRRAPTPASMTLMPPPARRPRAADPETPETLREARVTGELFLEVAHALEAMVAAAARVEGLTALEARTLQYVIEALPQYELAARLGVDPPRVTHLVRRLRSLGFVTREVDRSDRRVRVITATDAGRAVAERIGDRIIERSPLLHALTPAERARLQRLITRLRT